METDSVLLVYNSAFLQNVFSQREFTDNFKVIFSSPENFEFYKSNFKNQIVILILDETFAKNKKYQIVMAFESPVVFVSENLSESDVIHLYQINSADVIQDVSNTEILLNRLKNTRNKYTVIVNHFTKLRKEALENVKKKIEFDSKSGLYNTDTFTAKADEFLKNNPGEYVLINVDIDRFKVFNDLYGFKIGDRLLWNIGQELKRLIENDVIIMGCRIRAEHFVLLFKKEKFKPEVVVKYGTEFLENLYPGFYFNIRLGIYELPKYPVDLNTSLEKTVLGLISIKGDSTKHFAYYTPEMSRVLVEEQEMISDMVTALQNDEFKVWIQPQYDYAVEALSGAEALVRWDHPKKGMIPPGKFIPTFERNGFITQLDEFVWEKVCSLVRRWIDMNLNPVPVSVNISRRDIYNSNVPQTFKALLKKYKLSPEYIRLEITESAYMERPQKLISVVSELQKLGFIVEMDDFGSGYSSLNTLKDVPVDILKLDMNFIIDEKDAAEITENSMSKSGSILSSVVRMANWLKLPVIAEGIETKFQADYLKSIGCFHMQGYYFAKPMPCEEFEKFLETLPNISNEMRTSSKEIDNAVNFLDASTQSTLLFNSYVGGAAIIEWSGKNVEAIRINEQFFEELGTTREDFEPFRRNFISGIEAESRSVFLTNLAEAVSSGKPTFCEIKCLPIYKGLKPFWLRVRVRHLAKNVTSDIFYLTIDNIDFRMHLLEMNTTLSEQLAGIMETVNCGIESAVYDKKTQKFSVEYLNEMCARIFGYNQAEFRAKMMSDPFFIFDKDEKKSRIDYMLEMLKSDKSEFSLNIKAVSKDGKPKYVTAYGKITDRSDGLTNFSIVFVDNEKDIASVLHSDDLSISSVSKTN